MAYDYKYKLEVVSRPGSSQAMTTLLARFNFGQEVAPLGRDSVEERITKNIRDYLGEKGFSIDKTDSGLFSSCYFKRENGDKLLIYPYFVRLGFNLREISEGNVPLEKMVDLASLNRFVLTGEMS